LASAAQPRAVPVPRARAPRSRSRRAARGPARVARGAHAAGARAPSVRAGERARGRGLPDGRRVRAPQRTRAQGVRRARPALEQALLETGWEQGFDGEVVGMIPAGAFVAFGGPYEGMLPVRALTTESGEREWWELNEEGTILRGAHTGAALRLGDAIRVRVE